MSEFSNAIKLPERPGAVSLERLWNGGEDSEAVRRARIIQEHISETAPFRGQGDGP